MFTNRVIGLFTKFRLFIAHTEFFQTGIPNKRRLYTLTGGYLMSLFRVFPARSPLFLLADRSFLGGLPIGGLLPERTHMHTRGIRRM